MKFVYLSLFCFIINIFAVAQAQPGGGGNGKRPGGQFRQLMTIGTFYGKIVDAKNKPIAGASLQLTGNKFDTVTKQLKKAVLKTVITSDNGEFLMEGLPVIGNFTLKISAVGFTTLEKPTTFGIKFPQPGEQPDIQKLMGDVNKDLGNIKLETNKADLGNVTVSTTASKPQFELGIDRKIFNVDKNIVSSGQTATELMKSIPSVQVDIDGNVTLRNATPTIFIDGRPTTLTLDQIPSDIIDKVEIITNPSAKYDASGGNAGILNIILKKNKKNGYNGGVRAGVDSRGKLNGGVDLNVRENKINFFATANENERKSISHATTNTDLYITNPNAQIYSVNDITNQGTFKFFRGGFDYFADLRNTFTLAGSYVRGHFHSEQDQATDTTIKSPISNTTRNTLTDNYFENYGGQLSYKHNFTKNGHDITADANYNAVSTSSYSNIGATTFFPSGDLKYPYSWLKTTGSGYNHFLTVQADYENPITDDQKFESGVRFANRDFKSDNLQQNFDPASTTFYTNTSSSSYYTFNDKVYAAYSTYSFKQKSISYQLGLRVESSNYTGHLNNKYNPALTDSSFTVDYPVSLFPSAFITYKLNKKEDLQINYSRRINRPSFFQLLPIYDFTDPQNPSVGNPKLKPEFTQSFEFSYNNAYQKNANFLATAYFKYTTDLISRYSFYDVNKNTLKGASTSDSLYYTSYTNANNNYTYGLELTDKQNLFKWWELLLNFNFYYSKINATIPNQTISNSTPSWFTKINNNIKFTKTLTLQVSCVSVSKTLVPQNSNQQGGGGGRGMFGGGGMQLTSAQGYYLPRYFDVDAAIKKDWTWKNGQSGSVTLSINNIFRSFTETHTDFPNNYTQDVSRVRDAQVVRLNFNYRFGKYDISIFKRKNMKNDPTSGASEILGGQ